MSDPHRALQANVRTLYVVHVLSNAQFHLVIYTLFLLTKGFSIEQFFLIESAYALISLLMEIPTGVFSDRKSRKWSLVAASVIGAPVVPVIILSDSFPVVLIAMAVGGASTALVSGTDVAMLYDTLQAPGREGEFTQDPRGLSNHMCRAVQTVVPLAFTVQHYFENLGGLGHT